MKAFIQINMLIRLGALLGIATLLAPAPAHAQLQEVRQTVFGMDCAPCAYALERRLGRLDGVEEVTVSLNEGQAVIRFAPESRADLGGLRAAVRDAGFDPREATLRVAGTLRRGGDRWVLVTPSGERFYVEAAASDAARAGFREHAGRYAVVTGQVGDGEPSEAGWPLRNAALAP